MLKIGITGGMGSGKTTVCKIFQCLNIPVYDADFEAKQLYHTDEQLREEIILNFGTDILLNHQINHRLLAAKIFDHPEKRQILNALVHPRVKAHSAAWFKNQEGPYAIKEAALLIESGGHLQLDSLIFVQASKETRIQRVLKRNPSWTVEEIQQRMNAQMNEDEKKSFCQFEIINEDPHLLIPQVMRIHQQLCP
jgi:dephospho-CoA kinase